MKKFEQTGCYKSKGKRLGMYRRRIDNCLLYIRLFVRTARPQIRQLCTSLPGRGPRAIKKERLFLNFLSGGGVFPATLAISNTFFTGTNVLMSRHIDGWNNKRLGIIPIDYPESPANNTLTNQLFLLNQFSSKPHMAAEKTMVVEEGEAIA